MEKTTRRSVAPYYGVAAVWILYALFLPLYAVGHFLTAAVLSAAWLSPPAVLCSETASVVPDAFCPPQPASTDAVIKRLIASAKNLFFISSSLSAAFWQLS